MLLSFTQKHKQRVCVWERERENANWKRKHKDGLKSTISLIITKQIVNIWCDFLLLSLFNCIILCMQIYLLVRISIQIDLENRFSERDINFVCFLLLFVILLYFLFSFNILAINIIKYSIHANVSTVETLLKT